MAGGAALLLLPTGIAHATTVPGVAPDSAAGACHALLPAAGRGQASAAAWVERAIVAMGVPSDSQHVLHYRVSIAHELADESDRPYPPFVQTFSREEHWFDPATGVERRQSAAGKVDFLSGRHASFNMSGAKPVAAPRANGSLVASHAFNPWNVLSSWQHDSSVRVLGVCPYLDFDRVVVTRRGTLGEERLYLDSASAFPLKLETTELNYFLGPVHARYLYSAWWNIAPYAYYPISVIKQTDGLGQDTHTVFFGDGALVPRDSAPSLALPAGAALMPMIPPPRFGTEPTDTVRIGPQAFLLANHAFTSVIALAADTVYLFDAPGGEARARHDSTWIPRLFPGRHPVELVLLNPIWPHIAGVRFWVAAGARVVAPRLAQTLVRRAVVRRWTEHPDRLEQRRLRGDSVALHIAEVTNARTLAGGAVRLYALHGIASEGLLMAWLPRDRFLWASDRIQDVMHPSIYVSELLADVQRDGLQPAWTSGPHFHLIPWSEIQALDRAAAATRSSVSSNAPGSMQPLSAIFRPPELTPAAAGPAR
ncbi:MAG TPA: hypothetical protein VFW98_12420 [Gemmatimonadaceae bacterium]|nr:hypothetical protein [Gemmatimonadaceae bacterium]